MALPSVFDVTLINKDDASDEWTIRILIHDVTAQSETQIGDIPADFHDYHDYYDELVDVIVENMTPLEAFITQFVACYFTGDPTYEPIAHYYNTMSGLWSMKDKHKGEVVGYPLPSAGEWPPISSTKYWKLKGSDPDTCWYAKFAPRTNSSAIDIEIYDHSLTLQQTITLDSECVALEPYSYGIPCIQDWDAFLAAQTHNASCQEQGKFVVRQSTYTEEFDPDSAYLYVNCVYSYRISDYCDYYTFLWYLYNNGGGEVPEPVDPTEDDPYKGDYGPSGPGGGGGERPPYDEGDDIPYPDDPPVSICDTGLISLYTPSVTQLNLLAADIWSSNFISSLVKDVYADPIDVIINVGIVPFNVTPAGTRKIKVGERELDITANYPQSNYVNFDMGSVALKEVLGAYTDFAPYTKGNIYIPFVGFVPLDVDFFMGHNIGLKYKVDLCTGAAVAYLMRDTSVHQQFACNVKIDVPLSGADYTSMWNTIISATAALATAGAAGLAGATAAGEAAEGSRALQAGAKSASDIMTGMSTKPQIQKSNSMPNTGGLVGYPNAFIVIEHPALAIPTNQNRFQGYPSYINSKLSGLTGYTRVSSIHLGIAEATKRELIDIENSLKSGVIIQGGGAATATGIGLMTTDDPANVIGKKMTLVADLVGHFRAEVDIVNPVVTIERSSAVGFNYVYIADFGRYYFVDEVRAVRNNVLELHLSCDPLESFRSAILAHDAIIDKQEKQWNLYLNDDSLKMYQYPLIWRKLFENAFWDNFEYVLITAGH